MPFSSSSHCTREQRLIDAIGRLLPDGGQALDNDAFYDPETRLIYTTDMLVEGRHFDWRWASPADVGWKAVAVNFSDIAATGGEPQYILVSLALPKDRAEPGFVEALYQGLMDCCNRYGGQIIGGDTVSGPVTVINVTAIGRLPKGCTPGRRNTVKPGDVIVTTGFHGLSAAGLSAFQNNWPGFEQARHRHLRPEPRLSEALFLSKTVDRYALIDSSDGLADALLRLAVASGTDIHIDAGCLPVHPELASLENARELILYGGEDFELIAAVPEKALSQSMLAEHGLTIIGHAEASRGAEPDVTLIDTNGHRDTLGFERTYAHFEDTPT